MWRTNIQKLKTYRNCYTIARRGKRISEIDELYQDCYKYPPMLVLDLLVDYGKFFYEDSVTYDFAMLLLEPNDERWTETVLAAMNNILESQK